MANRYKQISNFGSESHFSQAVSGEIAFSRMVSSPTHLTAFNAGDIVPVYCMEVLPHDTISMSNDFVIRQTTLLTPTMGNMVVDFYAFFVPNRIVNHSWKTVMGENPNGSWTAPDITLVSLVQTSQGSTQVPVGSLADFYGFPTQRPIPNAVLSQCHDLKFRGYLEIYNEFFRDQNYQPPIPYSKLNVYENFFHDRGATYALGSFSDVQDNSAGSGALSQAIYGNLSPSGEEASAIVDSSSTFNALGSPLKANKMHDYFTSGLPSPQKGPSVLLPMGGQAPVRVSPSNTVTLADSKQGGQMYWWDVGQSSVLNQQILSGDRVSVYVGGRGASLPGQVGGVSSEAGTVQGYRFAPANLYADLSQASSATLADLRTAAAIQQVYEQLSRSGSRYREYIRGFFALDVDNPYKDIPTYLGHYRRDLQNYQTAQTSQTTTGESGSPQGNLAAFGYTANSGYLFKETFLEHGYVHVFAVIRHKNVYPSFMARDNFRLSMLDWYQPPLANISEQPVYTREINPFSVSTDQVFCYQEAWAEYRYDPDYVTGIMRPGVTESLSVWNYADDFNSNLLISTGEWLRSNSQEVLDRTLAVTSELAPQFKVQIRFKIDKERPMPTYSVPGLDIV